MTACAYTILLTATYEGDYYCYPLRINCIQRWVSIDTLGRMDVILYVQAIIAVGV